MKLFAEVGDYIIHPDDGLLHRVVSVDDHVYYLESETCVYDYEIPEDAIFLESEVS